MTNTIAMEIDGIQVIGEIVERRRSFLRVKLLSTDYAGLEHSAAISALGLQYRTFEGAHGEERARQLLTDLFRVAKRLEDEHASIAEMWSDTSRRIESFPMPRVRSFGELQEWRRASNELTRSGEQTRDTHQRELAALRAEMEEWQAKRDEEIDRFWATAIGIAVGREAMEHVIVRLDPDAVELGLTGA
jgi:hypothetical protein